MTETTKATNNNPYGNLSFSDYTLETEAERLVLSLQAAMKVSGFPVSGKAWKTLLKLKKAMARSKKYSFTVVPSVRSEEEPEEELPAPNREQAGCVAEVMGNCLGIHLKKFTVRPTSSGYNIVRGVYAGTLDELRIPPNPDYLVTADRAKLETASLCLAKDPSFKNVKVVVFNVRKNEKKNRSVVIAEAMYR